MINIHEALPDKLTRQDLLEFQLNHDFLLPPLDKYFTVKDLVYPFRNLSGTERDFYFDRCVEHIAAHRGISLEAAASELKRAIDKLR